MNKTILFDVDVDIRIATQSVHSADDHGARETGVFRRETADPNVVRMSVIPVKLGPLDQRIPPIIRLNRRRHVSHENTVRLKAAHDLAIPKIEECCRAYQRGTD